MATISKNKDGYGYKYADLAKITESLESEGLRYYQFINRIDGDDYIMTVKIDKDGKESAPLMGCRVVQAKLNGKSNPAQEQGSGLTYARRYSLMMAYGLATEDDDAESLTENPPAIKATGTQIAILKEKYTGENLTKLLKLNGITKLEDMTFDKASDLIKRLGGN